MGRGAWTAFEGRIGQGRIGGCERDHRSGELTRAILIQNRDVEGTMPRNIVILIVATGLFLCSVEVWAGGSRTDATDDAAVFVICNAL